MAERPGVITMKGNPLTLVGQEVKVGDPAPDFEVLANDLSPFKLSSLKGKVAIICSVPSLDTPTCDIETRWFNEEAAKLGPDVEILTISMDLPFAQKRWCGAAGVERVKTYSDHREAAFGQAYGVLDQRTAAPGPGRVRGGQGRHAALRPGGQRAGERTELRRGFTGGGPAHLNAASQPRRGLPPPRST